MSLAKHGYPIRFESSASGDVWPMTDHSLTVAQVLTSLGEATGFDHTKANLIDPISRKTVPGRTKLGKLPVLPEGESFLFGAGLTAGVDIPECDRALLSERSWREHTTDKWYGTLPLHTTTVDAVAKHRHGGTWDIIVLDVPAFVRRSSIAPCLFPVRTTSGRWTRINPARYENGLLAWVSAAQHLFASLETTGGA